MRVIITGGSGLIGRALTENLTKDGHEVLILSRDPSKVRGLPAGAAREAECQGACSPAFSIERSPPYPSATGR